MFKAHAMFVESPRPASTSRVSSCSHNRSIGSRAAAILIIGILALLLQGPAFATDPIDLDPDPDFAGSTTTTIVVDSPSELDIQSLPPGHYLIIVMGNNGTEQIFEIWVR